MSEPRADRLKDPADVQGHSCEEGLLVRSLGLGLPRDYRIAEHRHDWHQLACTTRGVLKVETGEGSWVVPPERAVWIPAEVDHAVVAHGVVRMKALYLRPREDVVLPAACCVVPVSPLLRELVLEILRRGTLRADAPQDVHLEAVLRDQVRASPELPLRLPRPVDERARRVAEAVLEDLEASVPLDALATGSGASPRTIERLFRRETGLSFGAWRRRAKVLGALERLAAGASVTAAGMAVGYESTSAFISMFRRELGTTPGAYGSHPFVPAEAPA